MAKAKTGTERVKSTEEREQATEFQRRRDCPRVEVRQIPGTHASSVYLVHHQFGDVGSKTTMFKRGKEVSVLYVLPPVGKL